MPDVTTPEIRHRGRWSVLADMLHIGGPEVFDEQHAHDDGPTPAQIANKQLIMKYKRSPRSSQGAGSSRSVNTVDSAADTWASSDHSTCCSPPVARSRAATTGRKL